MNTSLDQLPSISVVVPTYRRPDLVKKCIRSLIEQEYPDDRYEIIVVEDGSHDAQAVVESFRPNNVSLVYLSVPHGGAAATYGAGLQRSRCDLVAFIDDDAIAPSTWLGQIASNLVQGRPLGVIGTGGHISGEYPLEKFEASLSSTGELRWAGFGTVSSPQCDVDYLPGCNMAFWRDALLDIGGFDSRFSKRISWRHETDVCLRLRQRGHRLVYDPGLLVHHKGARWSSLLERVSPLVVWNMISDDSYFRTKNFGLPGATGAIKSSVREIPKRLLLGITTLLLTFVHLLAWIPGTLRGFAARRRTKSVLHNR